MDVVLLIGRILYALIFLASGANHLTQPGPLVDSAKGRGFPAAQLAVPVSGVYIILAALMIITGLWLDIGALALVIFLVLTSFGIHQFWRETDPGTRMNEQIHFMKDLALAGAGLVLFTLAATTDPGLVVVGPLLSLG